MAATKAVRRWAKSQGEHASDVEWQSHRKARGRHRVLLRYLLSHSLCNLCRHLSFVPRVPPTLQPHKPPPRLRQLLAMVPSALQPLQAERPPPILLHCQRTAQPQRVAAIAAMGLSSGRASQPPEAAPRLLELAHLAPLARLHQRQLPSSQPPSWRSALLHLRLLRLLLRRMLRRATRAALLPLLLQQVRLSVRKAVRRARLVQLVPPATNRRC